MKQVLIVDESPMFRDYLRLKLEDAGIEVNVCSKVKEGVSKVRSTYPDLIILDYHLSNYGFEEILKQKKNNLNAVNTPVIVLAQSIEQSQLLPLARQNIKKVFNKPIKIDALLQTISEILKIPFIIDDTLSIMEIHVNENIIFIEISQGLNQDKLELLRFKITELINLYEIRQPKIIVMLSNINTSLSDAPKLHKLLDTVRQTPRVKPCYIKILTKDEMVHEFLKYQKDYPIIEVVSNLQFAVDGLLKVTDKNTDENQVSKEELIGDKILQATTKDAAESMALKFDAEIKQAQIDFVMSEMKNLHIAVIDGDFTIQELIKNIFEKPGAKINVFSTGEEFLTIIDTWDFDLIFLDIVMPGIDGFEILKALQVRNLQYPVIILSSAIQRDTLIKAVQMGVKSYLVKPLKPEDILKKSVEILRKDF